MRRVSVLLICGCLWMAGCSGQSSTSASSNGPAAPAAPGGPPGGGGPGFGGPGGDGYGGPGAGAGGSAAAQAVSQGDTKPKPVPVSSGVATLAPENTKIVFLGRHVDLQIPDRTGGFEKFSGKAEVGPAAGTLKSLSVDIQTESVWTQIGQLTNHLRSEDFFDVRQYPAAKFESTKIAAEAGGKYTITGNLTLLETTKEISFPAEVSTADGGLTLKGGLTIDRTQFGMDRLQERVQKEVTLTFVIGEKTQPLPQQSPFGGGRGGPGRAGPGGGGFDPAAMFQRSDANKDGKLTGDEISERLRRNLKTIDTDGDGAITLEEYQKGMSQMFRGGGQFGGGAGGPRGQGGPGAARGAGAAGGQPQQPDQPKRPE